VELLHGSQRAPGSPVSARAKHSSPAPFFLAVSAVAVEIGGRLLHAAADGETVTVDGMTGTVTLA
jgi:hypothetical protein